MGYYTRYESAVTGPKELLAELVEDSEHGATFGEYGEPIENFITDNLFGGGPAKWYNWKDDLESLSASYPALLFTLKGEGEEAGDIWKAWARNGKVVVENAKIVFDEPDLDTVLPTLDVAAEIAKVKLKRRAEIDAEISRLEAEKASL